MTRMNVEELKARLLRLETSSRDELAVEWVRAFGVPAPRKSSREFLKAVGHHLQVRVYGDLKPATRKTLLKIAEQIRAGGRITNLPALGNPKRLGPNLHRTADRIGGKLMKYLLSLVSCSAVLSLSVTGASAQSGSISNAVSGYSFEEAAKENPDTRNFQSADGHLTFAIVTQTAGNGFFDPLYVGATVAGNMIGAKILLLSAAMKMARMKCEVRRMVTNPFQMIALRR